MKKLRYIIIATFMFAMLIPMINVPVAAAPEQDTTIVFFTGVQTTDTLANMIEDYNTNEADGYTIDLQTSTWETNNQHDTYATKFAAKDDSFDVISMDVIWPPEFTAAGWLEPLDDVFPSSEQDKFLDAPIQAGTYQGSIYGIPWFHDSAFLLYRKDVLAYANDTGIIDLGNEMRGPETWTELHDWTVDMLDNDTLMTKFENDYDQDLKGFVWQGKEYEGLICDFIEYLGGTGQYSFLDEVDGEYELNFNTTNMRDTLTYMKSLIDDGVSPEAVLTYNEEGSRAVWQAGNAIFHRNWPYAYRLSMDSAFLNGTDSNYLGADEKMFGVVPMPSKEGATDPKTSCLGGWQVGLNKYSKHKEDAKEFMLWLTEEEQQRTLLDGNGNIPTRLSVYEDYPDNGSQAYIKELLPVFTSALPRPVHPKYPEMSAAIQPHIHGAISGDVEVQTAINNMITEVEDILAEGPPAGIEDLYFLTVLSLGALFIIRKKRK